MKPLAIAGLLEWKNAIFAQIIAVLWRTIISIDKQEQRKSAMKIVDQEGKTKKCIEQ